MWQEGHTIHETAKKPKNLHKNARCLHATIIEKYLSIPVIKGKTESMKSS